MEFSFLQPRIEENKIHQEQREVKAVEKYSSAPCLLLLVSVCPNTHQREPTTTTTTLLLSWEGNKAASLG